MVACSDPSADQDRPKVIDTLRVELPYNDSSVDFDNNPPLAINVDGEFELKGKVLSSDELASFLAGSEEEGVEYLSVRIDEEAKFGDVLALLQPIAEKTKVYVAQTTGGTFRHAQIKLTDPVRKRLFVGPIGSYHLPLVAAHLAQDDQCVLLLGGGGASILKERPLDTGELVQVSTKFLERYVKHHGGPDAVADKPEVVSSLVARIQAQAETPWRCVSAPMERVAQIGWPVLQYELVP
jgi:hypothetical protein